METNIIGVKYEDIYYPKTFTGKEYKYFTSIPLNIGDIVEAPTKFGTSIARVSSINIPNEKIESFKDALKTITIKLDKDLFISSKVLKPAI